MVNLPQSFAEQRARADELDRIRLSRPLTGIEQEEADRLADRLYMRLYRQQRSERFGHAEAGRRARAPAKGAAQ